MTDKTDLPKVIYLIPDGDGYVWCEDPAPGIDMKEKDAIKYLSTEAFIEQACEAVDAKKKKTIPGRVSISMFDDAYNDGLDAAEQAIRDRFEENEQKEIKQKSNTNDLVRRFFNLTISERRNITQKLGLIENADMKVPEMERYKKAFIDAKEQGLIEQLADEVGKLEQA